MAARYTLVVGTANWSSWSLRPYLALAATGAKFETVMIALRQPGSKAAILKYSPSGRIPALKIAERGKMLTVWDSLAICETLNERHPQAGLWPASAAARAKARAYAAEMHSGFPNLRDQLSMDFARKVAMPELRDNTKAEIERILGAWKIALKDHKGAFLFGKFSIADAMYAPMVSRFVTYGVKAPPPIRAYMTRIMALPAMGEWGKMAQKEVAQGVGEYPKN
jgi:glutathione S-transferase